MSMTEEEFEQIVILREREFQAMGAAISNRNWHDLEVAYNAGRDRLDRTMIAARRWSWTLSKRDAKNMQPRYVDWDQPIEAVHEDGRKLAATARSTREDDKAQWVTWPENAGWIDYCTGLGEDHLGWRIRNVTPTNSPKDGFNSWATITLAEQCRMQAREGLDPDYEQFMYAVADRLADIVADNAQLREALQPFAKIGRWIDALSGDDADNAYLYRPAGGDTYAIREDHVRRAARAVAVS